MALVDQLRALGIVPGDLVMVHTSMRMVGGRAEDLVTGLDQAVAPGGTIVVNLGAAESEEPFDSLVTAADPDVGILPEVFRRTPGTVVNDHPDARFGARGAHANELLADTPWDDYYGPGSVLERLVGWDGKILRLGAGLDTVTALHYAEYLCDVSNKRRVRRTHRVRTGDGSKDVVVECLDDSTGIVEQSGEDYFVTITRAYLATGRAAIGRVGGATSELIDAGDLVAFGVEWMNANLGR
jgi:aminoglycoside N3'-acetyltransferase